MAIQRAVETDEVLRQTFCFFAICANEVLPLEAVMRFVKVGITEQPEELIKAKIVRSSLILNEAEEGVEEISLRVHNIVHTVVKNGGLFNLTPRENDENLAEAVKIFKSLLQSTGENYQALNKLKRHCKCLLEHMACHFTSPERICLEHLTPFIDLEEVIGWLGSLADICRELSDFKFAKYVVDLAGSLVKNTDDTHSSAKEETKARIFTTSGNVYYSIGEYIQAKELQEKALSIKKKILGEELSDVATSLNNLALVHYSIGEYIQAKELQEKALSIKKMILGEEHADVATSLNNLATVYYEIGEYNRAKKLYEKSLSIRKKILGEKHADVAASLNNLALVHYSIKEYNRAKELDEKALSIRKKILGEEHADVAASLNNLANVYCQIGEYIQAIELHENALSIKKKILGEEHAHVATCYGN